MDSTKKSSGGGLAMLAVAVGVAAYAGPKAWDVAREKLDALEGDPGVPHAGMARRTMPDMPHDGSGDAMGRCFNALANCAVVLSCPAARARNLLRRYGMGIHDAEDVVAATMLEVCVEATYEQTPQEWAMALMARVKFRRIDAHRRNYRTCAITEAMHLTAGGADQSGDDIAGRRVHAALCRLPSRDRCVIVARYFDDLDDASIQARCQLSSRAMVRKQLERARVRLKTALRVTPGGRLGHFSETFD